MVRDLNHIQFLHARITYDILDKPTVLESDDGNRPIVGSGVHNDSTNGGLSTCNHSVNTVKSGENPSAMSTSGVHVQTKPGDDGNEYEDNDDSRLAQSPKGRACTHSLPHDKTADKIRNYNDVENTYRSVQSSGERVRNISSEHTRPFNGDWMGREAQRVTLARTNSLHSSAEERVNDETSKEKTFSNVCAGSPTKVASDDNLYANYYYNDEGVYDEFRER